MPKPVETVYLADYQVPDYFIDKVDLTFDLDETTIVSAKLQIRINPVVNSGDKPLVLSGEDLNLLDIKIGDDSLFSEEYRCENNKLIIDNVDGAFELFLKVSIEPRNNTTLMGLYQSNGTFCTQCEAEGFRRIMYFLDRPDVLAKYTTTIIADKDRYPVLLSNGNCVANGELDNNRHWVRWEDPFKKPSYLFALVAGNLSHIEDHFVTQSGRDITLKLFVEPNEIDKTQHAMESLKSAMRWDEEKFGREYDLDIFMIVAVSDFNMGAMENKGLNIFNSKYILAKPETATDVDYEGIHAVVGHEYFHNWTGNRITCRDWFQLSLKEGLTVFRDQEFTRSFSQPTSKRIADVNIIRTAQFAEDAGPMAHPIRPASYIEMNNFYTVTVYNKGAEVIRMMYTLLGAEKFRQAMDLYFERHDEQAVTTDDFVQVMQDASGIDLQQFRLWYSQAGTPQISVETDYDAAQQRYRLTLTQQCPATSDQKEKQAMHIPIAIGLLDKTGQDLALQLVDETQPAEAGTRVLSLTKTQQCFEFVNISEAPRLSFLRDFSAPVKCKVNHSLEDLAFLLMHDNDGFNQWEAGQQLMTRFVLDNVAAFHASKPIIVDDILFDAIEHVLDDATIEPRFKAQLLTIPSETYLSEQMSVIDVDAAHHLRQYLAQQFANKFSEKFLSLYKSFHQDTTYEFSTRAVAARCLKNQCLAYLGLVDSKESKDLILHQFQKANNMTDQLAALSVLADSDNSMRETALQAFEAQWQQDNLVMDKWFAIQACSILPGRLAAVKQLTQHPQFDFKNPNKVRALISTFCARNLVQFHDVSGKAYEFLTQVILDIDKLNPQTASGLIRPYLSWKQYDEQRQTLIRKQLERIAAQDGLSKDVFEKVSKALL